MKSINNAEEDFNFNEVSSLKKQNTDGCTQAKSQERKQKRRETKFKDDDDLFYGEDIKFSTDTRKKNPPRKLRNSRKKRRSIMESDFHIDFSNESDR